LDKLATHFSQADQTMSEAKTIYEEKKANVEALKQLWTDWKAYKEKVSQSGYTKTQ